MIKPRQAKASRTTSAGIWEVVEPRVLLSLLAGLLLAVAITWGLKVMMAPSTLPLKAIEIEGDFKQVNADQIRAALKGVELGGLFSVDVERVREVTEALPWVERVTVSRKWPDTLHLSVYEHHAVARWGSDGLLDDDAITFHPDASTYPEGLPQMAGPVGQERVVMNAYYDMNRALAPVGLGLAALEMDARRTWRVRLDNGLELMLGRNDRERQLLRFVHVYSKMLAAESDRIQRIDLRYTNGFAVEWKKGRDKSARRSVWGTVYV